jgi:predicted enzyme related to lactoylglutathione lyase
MSIKYVHTNIIAKDWKSLANFYTRVFDCVPVLPERNYHGEWLEKGTGVKNAKLKGVHLRLPGYNESGPTLEIFQYSDKVDSEKSLPNKIGIGHLSFQVDDVENILNKAMGNGGSKIGEISEHHITGVGLLKYIYIYDPENNIIELQSWK